MINKINKLLRFFGIKRYKLNKRIFWTRADSKAVFGLCNLLECLNLDGGDNEFYRVSLDIRLFVYWKKAINE